MKLTLAVCEVWCRTNKEKIVTTGDWTKIVYGPGSCVLSKRSPKRNEYFAKAQAVVDNFFVIQLWGRSSRIATEFMYSEASCTSREDPYSDSSGSGFRRDEDFNQCSVTNLWYMRVGSSEVQREINKNSDMVLWFQSGNRSKLIVNLWELKIYFCLFNIISTLTACCKANWVFKWLLSTN